MPMFDVVCDGCGHEEIDVFAHSRDRIGHCPGCGGLLRTLYGYDGCASAVLGDEIDYIAENLGPTPIHIRSRAERRRIIKEQGLEEFIRHTGVPGTDKSPHTTKWDAISPEQMAGATAMLERVGGVGGKSDEQLEEELQNAVDEGRVDVPFASPDGRTLSLRMGDVYSGVIDMSIFKK